MCPHNNQTLLSSRYLIKKNFTCDYPQNILKSVKERLILQQIGREVEKEEKEVKDQSS